MAVSRFLSQVEAKCFAKYFGQEGGVWLRGNIAGNLGNKFPVFRKCNNALWLAPAWKWGLAIVPLYGVYTGVPKVEHLDLNQSLALTFTGGVWSYYALLVRPKAYLLFAVNIALLGVNGYNVMRKMKYNKSGKQNKLDESSELSE